jgi:hypothetical protein
MKRCAILSSAVDLQKGRQKKLLAFKDFLKSEKGGSFSESEILVVQNVGWQMAELLLSRLKNYDSVVLYRCNSSRAEIFPDYFDRLKPLAETGGFFVEEICDDVEEFSGEADE